MNKACGALAVGFGVYLALLLAAAQPTAEAERNEVCTALDARPSVEGATKVLHGLYSDAYVTVDDANQAAWTSVVADCPEHIGVMGEAINIATFGAWTLAAHEG